MVLGSISPSRSMSLLVMLNVTGWLIKVLAKSSVAMGGVSIISTIILALLVMLPVLSSTV